MRRVLALVLAMATVVGPATAADEVAGPAAEVWRGEEAAAPPAFALDLEAVAFAPPGRFELFAGEGEWGDGLERLGAFAGRAAENPPPGMDPPLALALRPVLVFDFAEPGAAEAPLFKIDRKTWDELDTWEKIGLVTSYASAVAGAVGLALELVD